jgi:hemerythrin-like domain-containing protein
MNDPMTILKPDHRDVKKMLTTLADTDEGSAREKLTVEVDAALRLHMEIEENILYPLIAKEVGAEDEEEAEIEHGLARDGLAKLAELVAKPGFGAAVEMLKAGIAHHVEEEETELLPELKSALSREWLALGDKIFDAKTAAGAPPKTNSRRRSAKRPAKKK